MDGGTDGREQSNERNSAKDLWMLKKNQPVKFLRPMSTMRTVLLAVEHGHQYRHDILEETKLKAVQVQAALYNLVFVGALIRDSDDSGRSIYLIPGQHQKVAKCLCGVNSIFNIKAFTTD